MTIMDREDKEQIANKKKKKKQSKKQKIIFYKFLSILLIVLTVITLCSFVFNRVFPILYLLLIIVISLIITFFVIFVLTKKNLRSWIKNIFSFFAIIIIILEMLMLLFGTKTLKFLSNITDTGYRVETFGIYVLRESNINNINDLNNKNITYIDHTDDSNIKEALKKIQKEVKIDIDKEETIELVLDNLISKEVDAILIDTNYEELIKDEFEEQANKIKLIDTIDIIDIVEVLKSDVDITKEPFAIYISGIDTTGNIASKARSDVNILLAINPKTKKMLMVNTPRDFYVELVSKGKKDKLTHAGLYGVEESLNTLSNLYDIDIDYYARVNFTSFIKIVDALDGIKVDVKAKFCEQDSNRSFKSSDLICLKPGLQELNGEQALALARHRKTLAAGDRARGENQMKIMEAIIDKALSPKIITKYSSLLTALDGRVTTNMTTNEMYKFIRKQLKKNNNWKFTSISAKGSDSSGVCYSSGSYKSYVMEPSEDSINTIKSELLGLMKLNK